MRQVEKELMILIEELLKEQYNLIGQLMKLFVVIVATAESPSMN